MPDRLRQQLLDVRRWNTDHGRGAGENATGSQRDALAGGHLDLIVQTAIVLVAVELGRQGRIDTRIDAETLDLEPQRGNGPLRMVTPAGRDRGGLEADPDDPRKTPVSHTVETETAAVVVPFAANVRFAAESDEPVWEQTAEMAVSVAWSALAPWARPERLRCARVVDDSMAPTIRDGDLVVLDAGRADPLDGQGFVVRTGEGILVKRLRRTDDRWTSRATTRRTNPGPLRAGTESSVKWRGRDHRPLNTRSAASRP